MVGAVITHLFIVGGSAVPATVLLIGSLRDPDGCPLDAGEERATRM